MNKLSPFSLLNFSKKINLTRKGQKTFIVAGGIATLVASGETTGTGNDDGLSKKGDVQGNPTIGDDNIIIGPAGGEVSTGAGKDTVKGGAGSDKIITGSGDDLVRGGGGNDEINTGDGNDSIVIVGVNKNGTYTATDISNPNGTGIDLSALISLAEINDHAVSDVAAGGSIDGGADGATLYIYGDVDLTAVTLKNIDAIQVQSSLTISAAQLNELGGGDSPLTIINGDGGSYIIIADSDVPLTVNFSALNLSNIEHLYIGKNITLIAQQADIDGIIHLDGKGILQALSGELDLSEIIVTKSLTVLDVLGSESIDFNLKISEVLLGDSVDAVPFFSIVEGDNVIYKVYGVVNTVLKVDGVALSATLVDFNNEALLAQIFVADEFNALFSYTSYFNSFSDFSEFNLVEYNLTPAQYEKLEFSNSSADVAFNGYTVSAQVTHADGSVEYFRKTNLLAFGVEVNGTDADDAALTVGANKIEFINGGAGTDIVKFIADFGGSNVDGVNYSYQINRYGESVMVFERSSPVGGQIIKTYFLNSIEQLQFADQTINVEDLDLQEFNVYILIPESFSIDNLADFLKAYQAETDLNTDELSTGGDVSSQPTDGNDTLAINAGNAITISTGLGDDDVTGSGNDDKIKTGSGNDTVNGGAGKDNIDGGKGNDTLNGGADKDTIYGGDGDDAIDGGSGENRLYGGKGNDIITDAADDGILLGGSGDDVMHGGGGNDSLFGQFGDDKLYGGAGDDALLGGEGADLMDGGIGGSDSAYYYFSRQGVTIDLSDGLAEKGGYAEGDILVDIENVFGSRHNDIIRGDGGANELNGYAGNDKLYGGGGNDILVGSAGVTELYGEAGDDIFKAGFGQDLMNGGDGIDTVDYSDSDTVIVNLDHGVGYGGTATGDSYVSIENIIGSKKDDILTGNAENNVISGSDGTDIIEGGKGNDTLNGGTGSDILRGEHGEDKIDGGAGIDFAKVNVVAITYSINFAQGEIVLEFMESGEVSNDTIHAVEFIQLAGSSVDVKELWSDFSAGNKAVFGGLEAGFDMWVDTTYDYDTF